MPDRLVAATNAFQVKIQCWLVANSEMRMRRDLLAGIPDLIR